MRTRPKILIVEGDRRVQTRLELAFAYDGRQYQVFSAPSGMSALQQLGVVRPDLVLLDVGLPGSDGWETLQRLREVSSVPVIALCSVDEASVTIRSLEQGADYCMTGPWHMRELRARVRALLRREGKVEEPGWQWAWTRYAAGPATGTS